MNDIIKRIIIQSKLPKVTTRFPQGKTNKKQTMTYFSCCCCCCRCYCCSSSSSSSFVFWFVSLFVCFLLLFFLHTSIYCCGIVFFHTRLNGSLDERAVQLKYSDVNFSVALSKQFLKSTHWGTWPSKSTAMSSKLASSLATVVVVVVVVVVVLLLLLSLSFCCSVLFCQTPLPLC